MTKSEAVFTLIHEVSKEKVSITQARKIIKALKTLDIVGAELRQALYFCDVVRRDGSPFFDVKVEWPVDSKPTA